jgi:hypothetical protein
MKSDNITVIHLAGLSGLIVPAATVGAVGYGYMWWKVWLPRLS